MSAPDSVSLLRPRTGEYVDASGQPWAVSIDNCGDEPIHIPNLIQPHGHLLAVADGVVTQASYQASALLGGDVAGRQLDDLLPEVAEAVKTQSLDTTIVRLMQVELEGRFFDVLAHHHREANGEQIIIELESRHGVRQPDRQAAASQRRVLNKLQAADNWQAMADAMATEIQHLTGFDRVMVYRFDADYNGQVVAEATDPQIDPNLESYLGLNYPATDIPAQARRLYLQNWVRAIPDIGYTPQPLVPEQNPKLGRHDRLDLSFATLRSVSPLHVEYLQNMGVAATLTVSLIDLRSPDGGMALVDPVQGRLWGLIACHHYRGPHAIEFDLRETCELVGRVASLQLSTQSARKAADDQAKHRAKQAALVRQTVACDDNAESMARALLEGDVTIGDVVEADGAAWLDHDAIQTIGEVPSHETIRKIGRWVRQSGDDVVATHQLTLDAADLCDVAEAKELASGVLAFELPGSDAILMWLRGERVRTVDWAGKPDKPESGRLSPRKSFAKWKGRVRGRSEPWSDAEVAAVSELRSALIEVVLRHTRQISRLNADLAASNRELASFAYAAAHDLREPIRGINNLTSFTLEDYGDLLDDEGRGYLQKVQGLTQRMDGLIASLLRYAQLGQAKLQRVPVDLNDVVADAVDLVVASQEKPDVEIRVAEHLPRLHADADRLLEVYQNLLTNAIKYAGTATPQIDVGVATPAEAAAAADDDFSRSLAALATGTVLFVRDGGIGIPPDSRDAVFTIFRRLHPRDDYGGGSGAGLTIVRQAVERHGGKIWITANGDKSGTTFWFTIGST